MALTLRSPAVIASVLTAAALLAGGGAHVRAAPPAPSTAAATVPEAFRTPVAEAGKICPQIDAPLVAAVISTGSGWDAAAPGGPGRLPAPAWSTYADPGAPAGDIVAGTRATGRYLCAVAAQLDKRWTGPAEAKPTLLLLSATGHDQLTDALITNRLTTDLAPALPGAIDRVIAILDARTAYTKRL